ncbi:unnamed protein product [Scytosiphon promiscuus]
MPAEDESRAGPGVDASRLLLIAGAGILGAWLYHRNRPPLPTSTTMSGRVCVVTGANAGIGKATATALAQKGAHVVLACRSQKKCAAACEDIRRKVPGATLETLPLDLSSVESIRGFVDLFRKTRLPLHVLVNNAEGIIPAKPVLVRGMEQSMVVNHLGPFLLTHLLLPDLRKSAAAGPTPPAESVDEKAGTGRASRIVNVGSRLEKRGSLWAAEESKAGRSDAPGPRWFEPPPGKEHSPFGLYGSSKLCNMLFTFELDRRLGAAQQAALAKEGSGTDSEGAVTVKVVTPGLVNTKLGNGTSPWLTWAATPLKALVMRTVEKGAETVVWAATSPEAEALGGGNFFGDMKEVECSETSKDEVLARQLWEASEVASGLEESERVV